MFSLFLDLIQTGSVMLLPVLLITAIRGQFERRRVLRDALLGAVFATVGLVVMAGGVELVPGIRTDPRAAVVTLSGLFGGPISLIITSAALAGFRLAQGGMGAVPGAIYIFGTGAATLALWLWVHRGGRRRITNRHVRLAAAVASVTPVVVLLFVSKASWSVFLMSNALSMPTNFLVVMLVGALLVRDREREIAILHRSEKQAQINAIAKNAPAVFFQLVQDASGLPRFTYLSAAAERILGRPPETMMGEGRTLFTLFPELDQADLRARLADPDAEANWPLDLAYAHPDGPRWLRLDAGGRRDVHDALVWDGTIIDITAQREADQMKDDFVSVVSHELRTPLTSIRGALGLALNSKDPPLPGPVENMLRIANRNAERLVDLVNEILDSQKIQAGQMELVLETGPIRPVVEAAITAVSEFAPGKRIAVHFEDEAPQAAALIDDTRLALVFENLLSNALKFAPPDSRVTVTSRVVGSEIRISVADAGPGIPADFHEHVFDRFRQAQSAHNRSTGGTGLGLSIARSLVEAMSGRIWFDTVEGAGTTFHVALPCAAAPPAADDAPLRTPRGATEGWVPHLLYVEDDDSLQQIIRSRIDSTVRISAARTLEEAEAVFRRECVDVLLLDLDLPDGMATNFLNRIPARIPVIVFSAFEVDAEATTRRARVMTKSRVPEGEVVAAVLAAIESVRPGRARAVA
ncbi:ATP-binding protein [Jannaschia ovalis]|uniref:histidine kinase n=1 Tax=Jannaschia ovalis TaxID=3038773 RepID=A0ABY8LAT4_9RHOB|nr:ATP-binding protein [Jannaschia sp. GRR-S6-38]WGH78443.1 ATP-binding protein [Jannaschia sp. GRR-S6-38]